MNKPFYHILCFLILSLNSFGQDNLIFNTRHLSVEDGLLGRHVNTIVQDNDGFIWIATNEGLNRFDGYEFQYFTKENFGLYSNRIKHIKKDEKGNIWLSFYKDQYRINPIQILNSITHQLYSLEEYLGDFYKKEYQNLTLTKRFFRKEIILVNDKTYYKYTVDKGIQVFETPKPKGFQAKSGEQYTIDKEIYPTKDWSLFTVKLKDKSRLLYQKNLADLSVRQIATLSAVFYHKTVWSDKTLYFPFQNNLLEYDLSPYIERKPNDVFIDKNNVIWIATSNGFYMLSVQKNPFKLYFKNQGNSKDENKFSARGIWANQDFLYGFSPNGSLRYNFQTQLNERIPTNATSKILRTVSYNPLQSLWVSSNRRYNPIVLLDTLSGNIQKEISLENPRQVRAMYQDHTQQVWVGTVRDGLQTFHAETDKITQVFTKYNDFDILEKCQIVHIVEDKKQRDYLWVATAGGWFRVHIRDGVQGRYWQESEQKSQIPSSDIYYTYQDKSAVYWLGTAYAGLLRVELNDDFSVKNIRQFTIKDGLSSNTIYGIFEDNDENLWMSSNNGIIKFSKKTYEIQVFLMEDGLSHYEFNQGSYFQRGDGTIFFGTLNGIVGFHPKDFKTLHRTSSALRIAKAEKFIGDDEQIANVTSDILKQQQIVLKPNEGFLMLSVALQDYFYAPKTKYAYKIEGYHKDFILTNDRKITLSGLPYGRYTLTIKAQGKENRFAEDKIILPLVVARPFYLRWWFFVLLIVIIVVGVWLFLKWRVRNLKNRQEELENMVAERTKQIEKDKATIETQANELKKLDEMKSRFFANVSHELRTPLTLILAPIRNQLKRNQLDMRDRTSAEVVQQNAQKLLKRINEILDLTKLEAKEMELKPVPTQFYSFTKRLAATFESLAQQKDQQLLFDYQLNKDLKILLDQDKYEHIFNNYLSNAIKYTPKGGIIEVQVSDTSPYLKLTVKDNGQGIPTDEIPKVFNRFFQSKTNKSSGSSGIGLALSKEIAKLMDGKVSVKSEVGKGSSFVFLMPYKEFLGVVEQSAVDSWQPVPKSRWLSVESQQFEVEVKYSKDKPTILLVEDNTELRQYIQLILSEKYNVITAENGQAALNCLLQTAPDSYRDCQLIISDIMMPVMDGFELLENLKSSDAFRHIPVVMLTARSNIKAKLEALRIGVDDYLLKPFQEEELIARIDNLLKNAENRQTVEVSETPKKEKQPTISASDNAWLREVERILKQEISNAQFNIDSLAEVLQMSRRQTHRRIKSITGLTPNQYFRAIKLQTAREYLENGTFQTVNEVAYAVGFDTPKYFSKLFEERFGKRPSAYF